MGTTIKIVFLDASTMGELDELHGLEKYGNVSYYPYTESGKTIERIAEATIVITNKVVISKEVIDASPTLKLVCVAATGTNNVDMAYAATKNILVKNVKGYSTDGVAQHTFALLLHILNGVPKYNDFVKEGTYSSSPIFTNHTWPIAELASMRVGIIGLGEIGKKVASVMKAFGAEVVYYSTSGKNTNTDYQRISFDQLLSTCDVISIHAPLNEATQSLIGYTELRKMKKSTILLNTGRGGIIDEAGLAKALEEGVIRAAALDVFSKEPLPLDSPLLSLNNKESLILTPHVAWAGIESRKRLLEGICQNIETFLAEYH